MWDKICKNHSAYWVKDSSRCRQDQRTQTLVKSEDTDMPLVLQQTLSFLNRWFLAAEAFQAPSLSTCPLVSAFTGAKRGHCPVRDSARHRNYCQLHPSSLKLSMWQNWGHVVALVQREHHVSCRAMPRLTDCTWASESQSLHSQTWIRLFPKFFLKKLQEPKQINDSTRPDHKCVWVIAYLEDIYLKGFQQNILNLVCMNWWQKPDYSGGGLYEKLSSTTFRATSRWHIQDQCHNKGTEGCTLSSKSKEKTKPMKPVW